jgi:hypothetical protein
MISLITSRKLLFSGFSKKSVIRMGCTVLFFAGTSLAVDTIEGRWSGRILRDRIKMVMTFDRGEKKSHDWDWTEHFEKDAFGGLEALEGSRFRLVREAGTIEFEGGFTGKRGQGRLTFLPSETFRSYLEDKGFDELTDRRMLTLCMTDVDREYVDELNRLGFSGFSTSCLIKLAIHDVSTEYIGEIRSMGYDDISLEKLIKFRIHGLDKAFVEDLRKAGYSDLSEEQLLKLSIHGVTSEYIREIRSFGLGDLSLPDILKFRIHGVTREYIDKMEKMGYRDLPAETLVKCRIHGVTPDFVRKIRKEGFEDISLSDLIKFRIHGIDTHFIRHVRTVLRIEDITVKKVVNLKIQGIG